MYRFVLGQIRTIRKTLSALVADIRLRTHMHIHMRSQRRLDREAFAALETHVLFRTRVSRLMVLKLIFGHETFPTAWERALVRFVAGVAVDVPA